MTDTDTVDLNTRRVADTGEQLQGTCALPTCQKLFTRATGPGRPAIFCGEPCRRTAQRERRAVRARLAHHERQVQQLRALVAAYEPGAEEDGDVYADDLSFTTPAEIRRAEDAVAEGRGMAKFLRNSDDPISVAFVELLEAVAPVIDHGRGQELPLS